MVHQLNSRLNRSERNEFHVSLERYCEQMKIGTPENFIKVRYSLELSLYICHLLATSNSISLVAYIKNSVFYEYYRSQTFLTAWLGRDRLISCLAVEHCHAPMRTTVEVEVKKELTTLASVTWVTDTKMPIVFRRGRDRWTKYTGVSNVSRRHKDELVQEVVQICIGGLGVPTSLYRVEPDSIRLV